MSELVERVARAICTAAGYNPDAEYFDHIGSPQNGGPMWSAYREEATAAIEAMPSPSEDVARLREALRQVDRINDNPARFSSEINDVVAAALIGTGGGWQDIETAPKDGTNILVWGSYDDQHIAAWNGRRWISHGCNGPAIESQGDFGTDYQQSGPLSHWRPLPSPPSGRETKTGDAT